MFNNTRALILLIMWVKSTCLWIHTATTSGRISLEIHFKFFEIISASSFPLFFSNLSHVHVPPHPSIVLFQIRGFCKSERRCWLSFSNTLNSVYACMSEYGLACVSTEQIFLELELEEVVSHHLWALGAKLRFHAKAVHALNSWAVSPDPPVYLGNFYTSNVTTDLHSRINVWLSVGTNGVNEV